MDARGGKGQVVKTNPSPVTNPSPSERSIRKAVRAALKRAGFVVIGIPGSAHCRGMPDLYVARGGESWWVELKRPGGRLRQAQRARFQQIEGAGIGVWVASSVQEALAAVSGATAPNWKEWS